MIRRHGHGMTSLHGRLLRPVPLSGKVISTTLKTRPTTSLREGGHFLIKESGISESAPGGRLTMKRRQRRSEEKAGTAKTPGEGN